MRSIKEIESTEHIASYLSERRGWCVCHQQCQVSLMYVSGPYTDESQAQLEADRLNDIHKETV